VLFVNKISTSPVKVDASRKMTTEVNLVLTPREKTARTA